MSVTMHPYLSFPENNLREAFDFYAEVFGGKTEYMPLTMLTGKPEDGDQVAHGALITDEFTLFGSDSCGQQGLERGNAFSVALMGQAGDEDRLRAAFDRLAEGGTVNMAMGKQAWGDVYGDVTDRFGIEWSINVSQGEQQ